MIGNIRMYKTQQYWEKADIETFVITEVNGLHIAICIVYGKCAV